MEKLNRKEQLLKELQDLEETNTEGTEEDNGVVYRDPLENEDAVQAEKKEVKEKKPRTAKQIEAFEKARQTREKNALARKQSRDDEAIAIRKDVEDKLVKKAIAVKKKQIKQQEPK